LLTDSEKLLTRGVFEKLMNGEVMTTVDLDRLTLVFEKCAVMVDTSNQAAQAASIYRLQQVLRSRFFPQNG
jgi:hypothetical protein